MILVEPPPKILVEQSNSHYTITGDILATIFIGFPIVFLPIIGFRQSLLAGAIEKYPKRIGKSWGILVVINILMGLLFTDGGWDLPALFSLTEVISCGFLLYYFFFHKKKA